MVKFKVLIKENRLILRIKIMKNKIINFNQTLDEKTDYIFRINYSNLTMWYNYTITLKIEN